MKNPVATVLSRFPMLVLDGALATQLEAQGCDLNHSLWSAKILRDDPALIEQVHYDYFAVGADCAITASYQATLEGFLADGILAEEAGRLMRRSVQLARQARDRFWADCSDDDRQRRPKPLVVASVGPYGAFLADGSEYRGDYGDCCDSGDCRDRGDQGEHGEHGEPEGERLSLDELYHFHRDRFALLADAGPDLFGCETLPCMVEAQALVRCLQEHPQMSAWFCFSCRNGTELRNGDRIGDCAAWLDQFEQVAAIGVNCTEPRYVTELIGEIRSRTKKPVVVYPNSGEQYDGLTGRWSGAATLAPFSECAREWFEAGATLIGGCCRTTPEDIGAIAAWARARD